MGCVVEDVEPDLTGADEAFEVLRGLGFAQAFGPLLETHGDELKETVVWNTRVGLDLTAERIARAQTLQTERSTAMRALLEGYDALALPVSQVAPFPVETDGSPRSPGRPWAPTSSGCARARASASPRTRPCRCRPVHPAGLPIGLQLVGRHRGELALLRLAAAIERATASGAVRPTSDRGAAVCADRARAPIVVWRPRTGNRIVVHGAIDPRPTLPRRADQVSWPGARSPRTRASTARWIPTGSCSPSPSGHQRRGARIRRRSGAGRRRGHGRAPPANGLEIRVCDDGRGMTPRLDSPGLGVGLPIVAKISERFKVEARPTGGTAVRMFFAVASHA